MRQHCYVVATGTTLLSYEMTWQQKYFELMTNSQQMGDWPTACMYGEALLYFVGLKDLVPKKEIPMTEGARGEMMSLRKYYRDLLMAITGSVKQTIDTIRNDPRYRKEGIVPGYTKQKEPINA